MDLPMQDRPAANIAPFDDAEYEEQCQVASFWTGSRLLVIGSVFLYGTFAFAYFYLRALDNHGNWRVGDQHASTIIGTSVGVCVVLASLIHYLGARRLQIGGRFDWQTSSLAALILLAVAAGLQVWQMTRLPFQPASSAYTSLFIAWMPVYIVYIVGEFYWLETMFAQSVRRPQTVLAHTDEGPLVVSRFGANVESFVVFSEFMIVVAVAIWVLFYIM